MRTRLLIGLVGAGLLGVARPGRAFELRAPQNGNAGPGTPQSAGLATQAAVAQMNGRPADALALAEKGIRADPADPWPHYDQAVALAELGRVDEASAAFLDAERLFFANDLWGKSVALYGRAHAYAQAGRCAEARQAFSQYAALIGGYEPKNVELVRRYEAECRASPVRQQPSAAPTR